MSTSTGSIDAALLRRCRNALREHRKRARKADQVISYRVEDLVALYVEAGARCHYCGDPLLPADVTFDHATPTSRVSSPESWSLRRLRIACAVCNLGKGALLEDEWRQLLALLRTFTPRSGADVLLRLRHGGRRYAGSKRRR